ncbi:MAG: hypothetical protein II282_08010 [Alistipes sp.]|nr:hypothetical protein [Alistipes sp.]
MEMKKITKEQEQQLCQPLPAEAKKKHPSKSYLTTINSIYVTERLNKVFGTGAWQIKSEIIDNSGKMIVVKTTLTIPEYGILYECYGGNDNSDLGDAYKGAVTDAITKIGSWLGIGAEVWKNHPEIVPQKNPKVINDRLLDNRERCEKMIAFLEKAYKENPESFAVIRYLQDIGYEFEDCADQRLVAIWMQHIENKGL